MTYFAQNYAGIKFTCLILGPLLFICFMNSISSLPLSPGSKLVLYADDIVLYQPTNSTQDTDSLQHDIQLL